MFTMNIIKRMISYECDANASNPAEKTKAADDNLH